MVSKLKITFRDQGAWQFEVPKNAGKGAKEVARLLAG